MNTLNGIAFTAKPKALAHVAPGNRHRVAERVGGRAIAYGSAVNDGGGMPALVCRHISYRPIPPGGANLANWLYPSKQRGYATGSSIPSL